MSAAVVRVQVLTISGDEAGAFSLPVSATVREVKQLVHGRGGPSVQRQRLLTQDGQDLLDSAASLAEACDLDAAVEGELVLTMVNTDPLDMNIALKSLGARVEGANESCGDQKPLLQHDVAFPAEEFGDDLLTLDAAQTDRFAGIPEGKRTGYQLVEQLQSKSEAWVGDCPTSTFLDSGKICVVLPGDGAKLKAIGFTYSPWDRNYGHECGFSGHTGDESVVLGSVDIPRHMERGDPSTEKVGTLFLTVPSEHQETIFKTIEWSFGNSASGRRLYFLYALGALV